MRKYLFCVCWVVFGNSVMAAESVIVPSQGSDFTAVDAAINDLWKDADIILVGENHTQYGAKEAFDKILISLGNNSQKRCLFLEEESRYQPAYDLMATDAKAANAFYIKAYFGGMDTFVQGSGQEPTMRMDFPDLILISQQGFSIFASDMVYNADYLKKIKDELADFESGKSISLEYSTEKRNVVFKDHILEKIGMCSKSIGIFGYNHIAPIIATKTTLPQLLGMQGLKVKTVKLTECSSVEDCKQVSAGYDLNLKIQVGFKF